MKTKRSENLKKILEEVKEKYPVGTIVRHKSHPWVKITDSNKFEINSFYKCIVYSYTDEFGAINDLIFYRNGEYTVDEVIPPSTHLP